jgi:tRNA (guanine10-N2)-dimethyltransferase
MQSVCVLGRQPELGLAELESLYGAKLVRRVGDDIAVVDVDPCVLAFSRLGGSIKLAKLLTTLDTNDWNDAEAYGVKTIPEHDKRVPEGKFKLGVSVHGFPITPKRIAASALSFKKAVKTTSRNVRIIPNKTKQLSSAQVIHNQLTGPTGWELLFIADGNKTILAQTIVVQDIEAYAARDQRRPKRDARVGMLPPKLAQIIVNLANGPLPKPPKPDKNGVCADPDTGAKGKTVLDPFCGTGVILQEASLMGYDVYGTDLDPRMVTYTEANLDWLHAAQATKRRVETADAMTATWEKPFDILAAETYLGRPLTALPIPPKLALIIQDCDHIHRKFLQNLAKQTKPGFRMCIGVPAWKTKTGFKHLPVLDHLTDMGYTRVSFVHSGDVPLVYHRSDQVVGRELVTLIRK